MSANENAGSGPSDYDGRCALACTRAGIALLVLAAISIGMVRQINRTEQLQALLLYQAARLVVAETLAVLDRDVAWQKLSSSPEGLVAVSQWTIEKLLAYQYTEKLPPVDENEKAEPLTQAPQSFDSGTHLPPGKPQVQFVITRRIEPLHGVVPHLARLGDGNALALARSYSPPANRDVAEWISLRSGLRTAGLQRQSPGLVLLPFMYEDETRSRLSRIFRPEKIVVADFPLAWFKEFTVPELFTLATHKLPSTEQIETMWREQASISFPYGGVSLTLLTGMVLIQLGTLVVFAYFWLFYREARRSQTFPAGATVFGALSRTRISRALFVVFLASPPAVAFIVASRTLWVAQSTPIGGVVNAAIALLILLVALAIRRHPLPRSMAS